MTNLLPIRPLACRKIMLVEDVPDTAASTADHLRRRGAYVEICGRVDLAEQVLAQGAFDAVILDHDVPPRVGTALALWLKNHPDEQLRRVIRISRSGQDSETVLGAVPPHERATLFHAIVPKANSVRELVDQLIANLPPESPVLPHTAGAIDP